MPTDFLAALLPEALVATAIVALMLLAILRVDTRWAPIAFGACIAAAFAAAVQQLASGTGTELLPGEFGVDRLALLGRTAVLACGLVLALAFPRERSHEFWLLAACSLLGATIVLDSQGFAAFFIGLEMLSLPAFALIVLGRGATAASEGALKYLVLSSVASALVLFGVAITYGSSGSLRIATWTEAFAAGDAHALAAGLLIVCGLFVKAAVFPFHGWAPDAYAAARLPVTALLASLVKGAVVLGLLRLVDRLPLPAELAPLVIGLGLASIAYGNLAALAQPTLRRLLAYSSVAHAGYMTFALLDTSGARVEDLYWYVLIYALGTALACASAAALLPGDDDSLVALEGACRERPVAAAVLACAVLSLAGLPPFPGFYAKFLVFRSVVASDHLAAAVAAFAASFAGLPYYVRIVLRLYASGARAPARTAAAGPPHAADVVR